MWYRYGADSQVEEKDPTVQWKYPNATSEQVLNGLGYARLSELIQYFHRLSLSTNTSRTNAKMHCQVCNNKEMQTGVSGTFEIHAKRSCRVGTTQMYWRGWVRAQEHGRHRGRWVGDHSSFPALQSVRQRVFRSATTDGHCIQGAVVLSLLTDNYDHDKWAMTPSPHSIQQDVCTDEKEWLGASLKGTKISSFMNRCSLQRRWTKAIYVLLIRQNFPLPRKRL